MSPQEAHGWLSTIMPYLERAGPLFALILACLLAFSLWVGIRLLRECVTHNRVLGAQLVTQQEKFHSEMLLQLAHCKSALP